MRRVLLAAAAALAMTGTAQAQSVTLGTKLELNTLDPHFFNGFPPASSHSQIWDSLTWQNEKLELEPALATAWRNLDENTWEFTLRQGVTFHDGTPFTADDVIATIRRVPTVPNSPSLFTSFTRTIASVDKVNDHLIRIRTSSPNPLLPLDLSRVFIIAAKDAEATTSEFNAGRVNGTGPYRYASWTNGERLVLRRNDAHFRGPAHWEQVTERVIARDPSRVAALLAGEVDAIDLVPTGDKPRLSQDSRFTLFAGPAGVVHYIALDSAREMSPHVGAKDGQPPLARNPLQDARVRRALSLAIDRTAIAERLMEGSATPASQFLPPSFPGTSQRLKPDPLDLAQARRLLAEAGVPNGFRLALHTTTDRYPKDSQIAQAVGQMWTRLGLQVSVEGVPGQVFFGAATRQEFSAFIAQYGTAEASEGPRAVIHTNDATKGLGAANRTRYSNPEVDALIVAALAEMDPEKRIEKVAAAIDAAFADQALIPVFHPTWDYAARKGIVVVPRPERRFNALMLRREG
ncbi:ABC transporter substrate-binding protein [Elioraea rosea]|uniref:ABC transporter substrate-binding protein n=1 Tax=Elioraea rosea TaxID=2492390 RepID=UPI0013153E36|nr:ABC transporter substrate-binding protein [Elioraea rosea]